MKNKIKEEYFKLKKAIKYAKSNPRDFSNFRLGFIAGDKYSEKNCQEQNLSLEKKPSRKKRLNPNLEEAMEVVKEFSNNEDFRKGFVRCWEYLEEKKTKQVEELKKKLNADYIAKDYILAKIDKIFKEKK